MDWLTDSAKDMLKKKYLFGQTLEQRFHEIATCGAKWGVDYNKSMEILTKGWFSCSTPMLTSMGRPATGMSVSCMGGYTGDSLLDIYRSRLEVAMLTKNSFGTSSYLGDIRPRGSLINNLFPSSGVLPVIRGFADDMEYVAQSASRRGSFAGTIPISHGDFYEVCNEVYTNHKKYNIGFSIDDDFIEKLKNNVGDARTRWSHLLRLRYVHGKGYIFKVDAANRHLPQVYKDEGLKCYASNLCQEILLPQNEELTYSCVLGSMVLMKYDEWKDTHAVETATRLLNANALEFISQAEGKEGFDKIVRFTKKFRAVGLGVMGLHSYLQSKGIVFGSYEAMMLNRDIMKNIWEKSDIGLGNASRIAIAPTKSTSEIMGGYSEGIDLMFSNAFVKTLAHGDVVQVNPVLEKLMKDKGIYSEDLCFQIARKKGSIQSFDCFTDHEKKVFKTACEVNQMDVLKMAEIRTPYIDQMQSLNLCFTQSTSYEDICKVHEYFLNSDRLFSLYYQRTIPFDGTPPDIDICEACQ